VRDTYEAMHRSAAVAHKVRSYKGTNAPEGRTNVDAQRGPALSPQRFGRVAQRLAVPAV
jgi:hypothetical protein